MPQDYGYVVSDPITWVRSFVRLHEVNEAGGLSKGKVVVLRSFEWRDRSAQIFRVLCSKEMVGFSHSTMKIAFHYCLTVT